LKKETEREIGKRDWKEKLGKRNWEKGTEKYWKKVN
jgi:hypothetical protein